jgi:precorrin-6A/cobalt-precorrin-6A reductase
MPKLADAEAGRWGRDPVSAGGSMPDVNGRPRVLILGGTTEGRRLAAALDSATAYSVISSLAGRTSKPLEITGDVRIGGFGGTRGLVDYLTAERIDALVDATHPFAATMTRHAVEAAARTRTPVLILRRPGWVEEGGDGWRRVRDLTEAAALLPRLGDRVFLTTGRQGIAAFAGVEGAWFLSRSVEKPVPPMPRGLEIVLDRGPFTLDGERRLLRDRAINVLVTKDSGGPAPKLAAARELGIPVIVVDRPPIPPAPAVTTVEEAVGWLKTALPKVARR